MVYEKKGGRPGHRLPPQEEIKALRKFESEVGGRDQLVAHLAHASLTQEQEYLVGQIADPRNEKKSLAMIAKTAGVPFGQLIKFFQEAGFVQAQLEAFKKVWKLLPEVAGDVMAKAIPREVVCPTCGGVGELYYDKKAEGWKKGDPVEQELKPCYTCFGQKTVTREPEHDVQKTALEIGGLLKRGVNVGVNVGVQNNQNNFAFIGQSHLQDFRSASDQILFPSKRASAAQEPEPEPQAPTDEVEAEVVK